MVTLFSTMSEKAAEKGQQGGVVGEERNKKGGLLGKEPEKKSVGAGHPLRGYLENLFGAEPNRKMTKAPPFLSLSFCT